MLILPITRSWMCSPTARRVYTLSAVLSLALLGALVGTNTALSVAGQTSLPPVTAAVLEVIWIPGILGAALIWVAMFYFWFGFDRSHWLSRAFWFLVLYLFAPFGAALYCFFIYRHTRNQEGAATATIPPS